MDDAFYEFGRRRAREERAAVAWAVGEVRERCASAGVDRAPLLETAEATLEGVPKRHRAAFEGMADELAVDRDAFAIYAFAFADLANAITEATDGIAPTYEGSGGCTNLHVAASRAASDGALISKNRDIVGRGIRPVSIVEQPAMGAYHGYVTVDTCGTVLLYKGANDAGLVAANTHVDVTRDEVEPGEGVRNGTVVRRILEECETVGEARDLVESYPPNLFTGHTLFLANGDDSLVLEVDPIAESVTDVTEPVLARTNHFLETDSPRPDSSPERLERARSLLDDRAGPIDRFDLERITTDHDGVPGEYTICRHAGEKADVAAALSQETTVSASIFEGGEAAVEAAIGYPCVDGFTRYEFGGDAPEAIRSGERWLAYAT